MVESKEEKTREICDLTSFAEEVEWLQENTHEDYFMQISEDQLSLTLAHSAVKQCRLMMKFQLDSEDSAIYPNFCLAITVKSTTMP